MKLFKIIVLTLTLLMLGTSTLWAEEKLKKPLDEVFDHAVVIPFDYHNKVFLNGQKADVYGDYKLFQKNGRVLVPIRLMSDLITWMDNNHCEVVWDEQKPDDVILVNHALKQTVKLTVNSKAMSINGQSHILEVPPQRIEGRIVLPLRNISEALNKNISWLDGLIIVSNDAIDLQSSKTLAIKDQIKTKLVDPRKELGDENRLIPVTKYNDTVYYIKWKYANNGHNIIEELYQRTGRQSEVKIDLPGENRLNTRYSQLIDNKLYYVSTSNGKSELHTFSFADNEWVKLCDLDSWHPEDGWIGDMKYFNTLAGNQLFVSQHYGDLTMGSEVLYKLQNNKLVAVASAKSFNSFDVHEEFLYFTDFRPMFNSANNLFKVNMETGEKETLGREGYTYGVVRTMDQGSIGYFTSKTLYIKDGYIYILGYNEGDPEDKASVYKISLDGQIHTKLSSPAKNFWLVDGGIYYIDLYTGHLITVDLAGNNQRTLIEKSLIDLKIFDGDIYYTAGSGTDAQLGKLHKYNLRTGQQIELSSQLVSQFLVGNAGVYYQVEGCHLGLYKSEGNGKGIRLVDDSIFSFILTDTGVVYTMRYQQGVYSK